MLTLMYSPNKPSLMHPILRTDIVSIHEDSDLAQKWKRANYGT